MKKEKKELEINIEEKFKEVENLIKQLKSLIKTEENEVLKELEKFIEKNK